jgi:hypothetical protein
MSEVATRQEALQRLSDMLRRADLDDVTFCKLLTFYAKLSGWFK